MSAAMLTAHITTTTTNVDEIDWDAAKTALTQATSIDLFHFEDLENDAEQWLDYNDDRSVYLDDIIDDRTADMVVVHDIATAILDALQQALYSDEVDIITLGGVTAFISGGLSHGDSPTDACEAIWAANALPTAVLHAAGLGIDITDDERPDTIVLANPRSARVPGEIMTDLENLLLGNTGLQSRTEALHNLIDQLVSTVQDSYSLALRTHELGLNDATITTIETTVDDAIANNLW